MLVCEAAFFGATAFFTGAFFVVGFFGVAAFFTGAFLVATFFGVDAFLAGAFLATTFLVDVFLAIGLIFEFN